MDFTVFIKSLSKNEKNELLTALLKDAGHEVEYLTSIRSFYKAHRDKASVRLLNILHHNFDNEDMAFIELVARSDFMTLRNAGQKTWEEFCALRGS